MATPVREQVLEALKDTLAGIGSVYGLRVERNRDAAATHFPTLVLYDGGQTAQTQDFGRTAYEMSVEVEGYVKVNTPDEAGTNVGTKLNALYAAVVAAVNADRTLGGVAVDVDELDAEFVPNLGEGQQPSGGFRVTLGITYWTAEGDPYVLGPG